MALLPGEYVSLGINRLPYSIIYDMHYTLYIIHVCIFISNELLCVNINALHIQDNHVTENRIISKNKAVIEICQKVTEMRWGIHKIWKWMQEREESERGVLLLLKSKFVFRNYYGNVKSKESIVILFIYLRNRQIK